MKTIKKMIFKMKIEAFDGQKKIRKSFFPVISLILYQTNITKDDQVGWNKNNSIVSKDFVGEFDKIPMILLRQKMHNSHQTNNNLSKLYCSIRIKNKTIKNKMKKQYLIYNKYSLM